MSRAAQTPPAGEPDVGRHDAAPDVLVIGAGAIGLSTAYELARRGVDVVVVDAANELGSGCSYGNAGLVSPSHCIPLARPGLLRHAPSWLRPGGAVHVKPRASFGLARFGVELAASCREQQMLAGLRTLRDLARASRDRFDDLTESGLDLGYHRDGLMNICRTGSELEQLNADVAVLSREGFQPEMLGRDDARRLEPELAPDIAGGVFWAEDGHCDPRQYLREMARAATAAGARLALRMHVSVFGLGPTGAIDTVQTNNKTWRPRSVVLAAGSWSGPLARIARTRIPLEAAKGYHVHIAAGAPRLRRPMIFQESVFAATPLGQELRLAGTMEFVGIDLTLAREKAMRLLREARRYLPNLGETSAPGLHRSAVARWHPMSTIALELPGGRRIRTHERRREGPRACGGTTIGSTVRLASWQA